MAIELKYPKFCTKEQRKEIEERIILWNKRKPYKSNKLKNYSLRYLINQHPTIRIAFYRLCTQEFRLRNLKGTKAYNELVKELLTQEIYDSLRNSTD